MRPGTPTAFPGDPPITAALVHQHKLTEEEYLTVTSALGRDPTHAELGVFSVMWSEHCSYKSSRLHLRRLPTTGPKVIQGPGENAGVVDLGDGFAAVFKMESHNHPSFLEPYQGAATGVGGILRDVFTMGARPVASLNSLRFGRPEHPRTPALLRGVVAGIGGYGNSIGVPTVGGEVQFDPAYDGNILVNAFTCGVVRADRIFYGRASGEGNPVLYVGARTGRDGIHGATMASDEFSEGGPSRRPTVQVGDPFLEKLLLEACLEIFAEDLLVGIQDMGAAGLTSSSIEMAGRAGSGIELDLDLVPRRARAMTPYEMLLSESQERMLLVARPGCDARVVEICEKWELSAVVIGRVTTTGRWVVRATPGFDPLDDEPRTPRPVVVCDLPIDLLTDAAPRYDRPRAPDPTLPARHAFDPRTLADPPSWSDALVRLVGSPNVGSRRWIWRQYDSIVRGGTGARPGGDAAVVRVLCERDGRTIEKLLAFSVDCNGRLVELDPFQGAAAAVAEACRNLACTGAEPVGLTDCLNFGSPERPEIMEQFARAVDGMAAACLALDVPIVSGNVSFYNETDGRPILPTPTVAAVGQVARAEELVRATWHEADLEVLLLGEARGGPLGGSEYLAQRTRSVTGRPPTIDLAAEVRLQRLLLALARARLLASAHDVADGGLAATLAECCVCGEDRRRDTGARLELPDGTGDTLAEALFGEAPSRVVVACAAAKAGEVARLAAAEGVTLTRLGQTGGDRLILRARGGGGAALVDVALPALRAARESCLAPLVGD